MGIFKFCETLCVYLSFFNVIIRDSGGLGILQGNFVCVHLPPLFYS